MASQTWMNLLNGGIPWQTTNGTLLTTSASTATISPQATGSQDFILPGQPNGLQFYPGMTLHVRAGGTINSAGTTSALTVFVAIGVSGTLGTTLASTGALTLGTGSLTGVGWTMEMLIRVLALGGGGSPGTTLSAGGTMELPTTVGANTGTLGTANNTIMNMPETTTAFNLYTGATAIGLRATLSAAFGGIQCNQFLVEQLC